jgi:hypothetical protein
MNQGVPSAPGICWTLSRETDFRPKRSYDIGGANHPSTRQPVDKLTRGSAPIARGSETGAIVYSQSVRRARGGAGLGCMRSKKPFQETQNPQPSSRGKQVSRPSYFAPARTL